MRRFVRDVLAERGHACILSLCSGDGRDLLAVLACGIFGNVPDEDVEGFVRALPQLLAEGGVVVWTRHRRPPDLTPAIRAWLVD